MDNIGNFLKMIVDTMDQHEGMVAMLGIAVTVLIFLREVRNNYFTMERDNFNDIFKDLALKQLPEKIDGVEQASGDEWSAKFSELMNVLDEILINSKYYKYSIPFFYECLSLRVDGIRDLERHDNWRLYRNAVKQNILIQKKCRAIIRNINNASKGRVFSIRFYQNILNQKLRKFFTKNFSDHPADRIAETYIEDSLKIFIFETVDGQKITACDLKKLSYSELIIKSKNAETQIINTRCVESGDLFFGYTGGIRWGKEIGKIIIKAKRDRKVYIRHRRKQVVLRLNDKDVHKIILMWNDGNDKNHVYFNAFNVRLR